MQYNIINVVLNPSGVILNPAGMQPDCPARGLAEPLSVLSFTVPITERAQ